MALRNLRKINEERIEKEAKQREARKSHPAANQEALADENYNPEIDDKVKQLYELMAPCAGNPHDAALEAEYTAQFLALPTTNVYTQVLVNPRRCDIDRVQDDLAELVTHFPTIRAALPTGDHPAWDSMVATVTPQIATINTSMTDWGVHTDRQTANLPFLASLAQGALGMMTALNGLMNPCAGLGNFLGSIMDKGAQLMGQITGAIGPMLSQVQGWASGAIGAVGAMTSAISGAIGQAIGAAGQIAGMIAGEIGAFAGAMIGQLRMGLAEFMASMKVDPCLAGILGGVAGAAAAKILG